MGARTTGTLPTKGDATLGPGRKKDKSVQRVARGEKREFGWFVKGGSFREDRVLARSGTVGLLERGDTVVGQ